MTRVAGTTYAALLALAVWQTAIPRAAWDAPLTFAAAIVVVVGVACSPGRARDGLALGATLSRGAVLVGVATGAGARWYCPPVGRCSPTLRSKRPP